MEKCYICEKGNLKKKKTEYKLYGIDLGKFDAMVCDKCDETFYNEENGNKITEKAKKKGVYGLEAKTKIGVVGSTLDIRLPKRIINFMKLQKGEEVTIRPEGRRKLIITI